MKKFLSLFLALTMVLSMVVVFSACTSEEDPTETPSANSNPSTDASEESSADASADPSEDASEDASEGATTEEGEPTGTLKMVTNAYFEPYEYFKEGEIVGIDAEIAAAIAEKLGMKLVIESINFDSIISSVKSGDADFGMAGMTVTDERKEEVDFSLSYATGCQMLVVGKNSALTSLDDLVAFPFDDKGDPIKDGNTATKIGVQLGTTGALYAEWDGYDVVPYTTANEAILALKNGDVECVMIDSAPAQNFVDSDPENLRMIDGSEAYVVEEYAICVKKGNTELLNKIDAAIEALMEDGTIDAIIEKYIPSDVE